MRRIGIGLAGSGFAAALHAEAYRKVYGYDVRIEALYSTNPGAAAFAARFGIPRVCSSFEELVSLKEVEVVDLCTPPAAHAAAVVEAMEAGRHVICEKPLGGYFGRGEARAGDTAKRTMYEAVDAELRSLEDYLSRSSRKFFYAENYVYAPAVRKTKELLEATGAKVLCIKGEESHSGSHSPHAARWSSTGGGSLLRQGCHPLSAALHLKGPEARVVSVSAEVGSTLASLGEAERGCIAARPEDVEDWACATLNFSDGTKAVVTAADMTAGGVRNTMEVYTPRGAYLCSITPNNQLRAYHADGAGLADVYITEKVETKTGWQDVFLSEEYARGYVGELQDFMECLDTGREPLSDFRLARDTLRIIYGAYVAAEEGRRFTFE